MSKAYYNEIDPVAAAWLRELIHEGLIAYGEVDERSIVDVIASDLIGYSQHHFFAGIGGWPLALRLAGWPDDKPIWTGSCPCQPFSVAGKSKGKTDERHLWPHFYRLIKEHKPNTIAGEQVEGAIKHGWLDDLQADLEREGYAVGHCVLGAHSINSAHIRQRLYWVAHAGGEGSQKQFGQRHELQGFAEASVVDWMGQPNSSRPLEGREATQTTRHRDTVVETSGDGWMDDTESIGRGVFYTQDKREADGEINALADSSDCSNVESQRLRSANVEWIYCRDNKYRPIKSGIKPLVNGLPRGMVYSSDSSITPNETQEARVARLKGYGNAIIPQVAAEFIAAFMEVI